MGQDTVGVGFAVDVVELELVVKEPCIYLVRCNGGEAEVRNDVDWVQAPEPLQLPSYRIAACERERAGVHE